MKAACKFVPAPSTSSHLCTVMVKQHCRDDNSSFYASVQVLNTQTDWLGSTTLEEAVIYLGHNLHLEF